MRWQQLFADLSAQFEEEAAAAERGESASRARAEIGALRLVDRLGGALGQPVVLSCRGAGRVAGVLTDAGVDWLLVEDDRGSEHLVATAVVTTVAGLGRRTAPPVEGAAARVRPDLRRALKGLARDRAVVQLVLDDGALLTGTIDRVGADYLELAEHAADEPRRVEAVRGVRAVVLTAVGVVRTVPPAFV
jgi:hypothetical protein